MNVDVHAHLFPQSALRAMERGQDWHGSRVTLDANGVPVIVTGGRRQAMGSPRHVEPPEVRTGWMDDLRVDLQVVSLLPPLYRYRLDVQTGVRAAQAVNDELAEMQARRPARFAGLATLPLQDVPAALRELERAAEDLHLRGVSVATHVNGRDWDDPELFPVLEAAAARGLPVLIHPVAPRGPETFGRYYLGNLIGNPVETMFALAALVFGGVFDRLPDLRVLLVHGGGYVSAGIGRLDHGADVRKECRGPALPPSGYLGRCWFDTLTHGRQGLRSLIETVGVDRVVMGSDYPADMGDADPVATVEACDWLTDGQRSAIAGDTALRLFGFAGPGTATG